MSDSGLTKNAGQRRVFSVMKGMVYFVGLGMVCAYVLLQFLKPTPNHIGINQYENALFLAMVDGTAYKPYVYRRLLPGLVHFFSTLAPESTHAWFFRWVVESSNLRFIFSVLNWEPYAAFPYALATLGMWIAFLGFAHYGARFTLLTCKIVDRTGGYRFGLSIALVLFLLPFFKYASYVYDPPNLFLFTFALYALLRSKVWVFGIAFFFGCINKETAVLLIPIALWTYYGKMSRRHFLILGGGLIGVFVAVKGFLSWQFRSNPGGMVEWHLGDHNVPWFMQSMGYHHVILGTVLLALLFYRWKEKDLFLRRAWWGTAPILVIFTLFFGYIDEWRDYYEAYPVLFALMVDSLRRLTSRQRGAAPVGR